MNLQTLTDHHHGISLTEKVKESLPSVVLGASYFSQKNHKIKIIYVPEHSSNKNDELASLHLVMKVVISRNLSCLHLYGDSNMLIDWANKKIQIKSPHLQHILKSIRRQLESFSVISFVHVHGELDTEVYKLSKNALLLEHEKLEIE